MVERYHSAYSGSMFPHPASQYADEYVSGEDYDALATEVATLRARLAEAERDARRWRIFTRNDLTYTREPLVNARTGEAQSEVRWTIWWNGPHRALFVDAVDAAQEDE